MARPLAQIMKGHPIDFGDPDRALLGTGPFMLTEYVPDERLVLDWNSDYFRGDLPYLDTIEIFIMQEKATQLAALRTGQVDFHNLEVESLLSKLSVDEVAIFEGEPGLTLEKIPADVPALWFRHSVRVLR